jgi:hypothetical protein
MGMTKLLSNQAIGNDQWVVVYRMSRSWHDAIVDADLKVMKKQRRSRRMIFYLLFDGTIGMS